MGVRVLVVDDQAEVRSVVRFALHYTARVHVVGEAANCASAVAMSQTLKPDVVVLDLVLPDEQDGGTFARLSAASPQSRMVIYSAYETGRAMYEDQGATFVGKGDTLRALIDAVLVA